MQRGAAKFGPDMSNWRKIQPLGDRVVTHIYEPRSGGGPIVIVLAVLLVLFVFGVIVCYRRGNLSFGAGSKLTKVEAKVEMKKTIDDEK